MTSLILLPLILKFVAVALAKGLSRTYGQIAQLWHFFMPGIFLLGLELFKGGTLYLMSLSLIFCGLLYATRGGSGNVSFSLGSWVIVRQCLLIIPGLDGNLGS